MSQRQHSRLGVWLGEFLACLGMFGACSAAETADVRGRVTFGGIPVPGVTVTATQGSVVQSVITDSAGFFQFSNLSDGVWIVETNMQLFASQRREIVLPTTGSVEFELPLAPSLPEATASGLGTVPPNFELVEVRAVKPAKSVDRPPDPPPNQVAPSQSEPEDIGARGASIFLISGSQNNGATTPFALTPSFGNNRPKARSPYNGNLGLLLNHASFDARPYSLTGQNTPKPDYSRVQSLLSFGGPLRIPGILQGRNLGWFTVQYQRYRNRVAETFTALMPTLEQRTSVPEDRISPQAKALLALYPLPNFDGGSGYNYQVAAVSGGHRDDLQASFNQAVNRNTFQVNLRAQSRRDSKPDQFGFLNTSRGLGLTSSLGYRRLFRSPKFFTARLEFSRLSDRVTPFFSNRINFSAVAGIQGNNQDPENWGPPNLQFASGIAGLTLPQAAFNRYQSFKVPLEYGLVRGRHDIALGFAFQGQHWNLLSQEDARGTFSFTGDRDFQAFLLGLPAVSSIAFGNADKYLRNSVYELFIQDKWRASSTFTVNVGVRWDYSSPVREKYGRLVNLAISPGFSSAVPVIQRDDTGGDWFPRPDRNNIAPRIGLAWRPFAAAAMVFRGGYGIYYDSGVYQPVALRMAQQAPLSTSLRVASTPETPLTLANGFPRPPSITQATTFGVTPNFRVGYAQVWQFTLQTDLPAAMQLAVSYQGIKGTRAQQQFLPNTFPDTFLEPAGFTYLVSDGNSIRHAGQVRLRRRLSNGFAATMQYTYAKSIDNASLGGRNEAGPLIAQNWLDFKAERARSNFDERHVLDATLEYSIWARNPLLRNWTFTSQFVAGSGSPLTPIYFVNLPGTGVVGSIRPDYTGAPLYDTPPGLYVNPAAFAPAPPGRWGNAGRNIINGPARIGINASAGRTFAGWDRLSFDVRLEAVNALNNVVYTRWNTIIGNSQFGLPNAVNPMRTVRVVLRARF